MQLSSVFDLLGKTSLTLAFVVMVVALAIVVFGDDDDGAHERSGRLMSLATVLAVTSAVLVVIPSVANSVRADSGPAAVVSPSSLDAS